MKHSLFNWCSRLFGLCLIAWFIIYSFERHTSSKVEQTLSRAKAIAATVNTYVLGSGSKFSEDDFQLADISVYKFFDAKILNDAWGNPFTIRFDSIDKFKFYIISWGADGIPSTDKTEPDIIFSAELNTR